jgi:hypothetical protein
MALARALVADLERVGKNHGGALDSLKRPSMIVVLMGVSGSGKTTVGKARPQRRRRGASLAMVQVRQSRAKQEPACPRPRG